MSELQNQFLFLILQTEEGGGPAPTQDNLIDNNSDFLTDNNDNTLVDN